MIFSSEWNCVFEGCAWGSTGRTEQNAVDRKPNKKEGKIICLKASCLIPVMDETYINI